MPIPDFPTDEVALLAAVNGNPYNAVTNPKGLAAGGHRQNWNPAMNGAADVAGYMATVATFLDALADQVATDAASAAAGSGTEATAANIRAGLTAQYLSIRRSYEAMAPVALTDAATIAWDMADGVNFKVTIAAAGRALANPTNQVAGKSGLLSISQDATGGRTITSWGSHFVWIGGDILWPVAANAVSLVSYYVEASGKILLSFGGSSA